MTTILTVLRSITGIRIGFPGAEAVSQPFRSLDRWRVWIVAATLGLAFSVSARGQEWRPESIREDQEAVRISAKPTSVTTGDTVDFAVQLTGDWATMARVLVISGQAPVPFSGASVRVPFNTAGEFTAFVAVGGNALKAVAFVPRLRSRVISIKVKDPIQITVTQTPPPPPKPILYDVTLRAAKTNPRVDEPVDFTAVVTPASKRIAYRFVFDGEESAPPNFTRATKHSFADGGKHTAYVEVGNAKTADNGGGLEVLARSAPVQIEVQPRPRLLLVPAEARIRADQSATFTVMRADKSPVDDFTVVPDETGAEVTKSNGNQITVRSPRAGIFHPSVVVGSQQASALLVVDAAAAPAAKPEPETPKEPDTKPERDWKWWVFAGIAAVFAGLNVVQMVRRTRWIKPGASVTTRVRPDLTPSVKPGKQKPGISFSVRVVRKGGRSAVRANRGKLVQFQRRSHE